MTNRRKQTADFDQWEKMCAFFYLGHFTVANDIGMSYYKSSFFIIVRLLKG